MTQIQRNFVHSLAPAKAEPKSCAQHTSELLAEKNKMPARPATKTALCAEIVAKGSLLKGSFLGKETALCITPSGELQFKSETSVKTDIDIVGARQCSPVTGKVYLKFETGSAAPSPAAVDVGAEASISIGAGTPLQSVIYEYAVAVTSDGVTETTKIGWEGGCSGAALTIGGKVSATFQTGAGARTSREPQRLP